MKQALYDEIVDRAFALFGNELNPRADFDSALAEMTRMDSGDVEYTDDEIDAFIDALEP